MFINSQITKMWTKFCGTYTNLQSHLEITYLRISVRDYVWLKYDKYYFFCLSQRSQKSKKTTLYIFICMSWISSVPGNVIRGVIRTIFSDFNGHFNGLSSIKQALTWRSRKLIARKGKKYNLIPKLNISKWLYFFFSYLLSPLWIKLKPWVLRN